MPGCPSSPRPAPRLRGQTPSPRPPAFFCLSPPQLCPGPPPSLQNHQQPLPPTGCCPELCHSQRLLSPPRGPGSVLSTEPREAQSHLPRATQLERSRARPCTPAVWPWGLSFQPLPPPPPPCHVPSPHIPIMPFAEALPVVAFLPLLYLFPALHLLTYVPPGATLGDNPCLALKSSGLRSLGPASAQTHLFPVPSTGA